MDELNNLLRRSKRAFLRRKAIFDLDKTRFPLADRRIISKLFLDGEPYILDPEIELFARQAKPSSGPIVEIGCAFGASSVVFLLHSLPGVEVHSIDPFVQDSMLDFQATEAMCRTNVSFVLKSFAKEERLSDWKVHSDYSYNIVRSWVEPIEILFVDGDHNYDAVRKDFEDWFPFVKPGGFILFHDSRKIEGTPEHTFNRGWAGPTRFASELKNFEKVKLVEEVQSVTVWQKMH